MQKNLIRKRALHDYREVEKILRLADKFGLKILFVGRDMTYRTMSELYLSSEYKNLTCNMIVHVKATKIEITTKYYKCQELVKKGLAPCTFVFDLNDNYREEITGQKAFMQQQQAYKINKIKDDATLSKLLSKYYDEETNKYICSASPIINYNSKFEKQELFDCYEYDINSAYSSIIIDKIPDTTSYRLNTRVKKNEVGFLIDEQLMLVEQEGMYADIVFKIIESPESLRKYHINHYSLKKLFAEQRDDIKKQAEKDYLNLPVGYCQRFNPFIRAYIVHKCNNRIKALIDENTLFCNTDAIFSKVRRYDLEIGDNIGQFKEVYIERLAYIGNTYQINFEHPTYRGVPKQWFKQFEKDHKRKYDILKDELPEAKNIYSFDKEHLKLVKER